jgi:hypothetical protein
MDNVYEKALEVFNSGLFLQMEGSFGRYYVNTYIDSGIIKTTNDKGRYITDGYGRQFYLKKFFIDYDRIDYLKDCDPDFIYNLENGGNDE